MFRRMVKHEKRQALLTPSLSFRKCLRRRHLMTRTREERRRLPLYYVMTVLWGTFYSPYLTYSRLLDTMIFNVATVRPY